jgi:HD-like signal output (HDOD) protein/CheY-like chemotaxis protein
VGVPDKTFQALVVDDELLDRKLVASALESDGFRCHLANDGGQALEMLAATQYDVVVTDLRMPTINGHALALEILANTNPPVVIVVTCLMEPRLTKDLLRRGVDDVVFKPFDAATFAAKVRALVENRLSPERQKRELPHDVFYQRVADVAEIPPLSLAVLDVFHMASSDDGDADQLAANVARDASLAADVLRAANSAFHNPSGQRIGELRDAVARLGRRRIAGLALARHALFVTSSAGDLIDLQLAWRQSVGAGVAIELLAESSGHAPATDDRLFLCSVMHGLGRLILMSLFPLVYRRLLLRCQHTQEPLCDAEADVFPETHTRTLRCVLEQWGVPPHVVLPLAASADGFSDTEEIDEPLRQDVQLVKTAALIGRIASGAWESWDEVEFPSPKILSGLRLKGDALARIVQQTRDDTEKLCGYSTTAATGIAAPRTVAYWRLPSAGGLDWLEQLLPNMGIVPSAFTNSVGEWVLVNCLEATPDTLQHIDGPRLLAIASREIEPQFSQAQVLCLPTSFRKLESVIQDISMVMQESLPEAAGSSAL